MLNMLRMDFYRLIRSKSFYVCFAILVAACFLCYWTIWLVSTPAGQAAAERMGMTGIVYIEGEEIDTTISEQYDTLEMFREIGMDGGAYTSILGVFMALFVCMDFHSGFVKNTLSIHRSRWKYIGCKILLAGLANLCVLLLLFGISLLMNLFFGGMVSLAGLVDILFYMSWAWLNTTAFLALVVLIASFTRSGAASITATLLLGSGLVQMLLAKLTGMFGASGWMEYTLYYNLTYGPSRYTGPGDLKTYAVSCVFLTVCAAAAAAALSRRDV